MESPGREQDEYDHLESSGRRNLFCDGCGSDDFAGGDDGFFYCSQCGFQSQDVIATEADAEDVFGERGVGALYSIFHQRAKSHSAPLFLRPHCKIPAKEEILRSLNQSAGDCDKKGTANTPYMFDDESSSPQDFGYQVWDDLEKALDTIRSRYVHGLQVMLQLQCEALIKNFEVSPLICGMSMTIWLKHIAVSRVFEDGWVEKMIDKAKVESTTGFTEENILAEEEEVICGKEKLDTFKKKSSKLRKERSETYKAIAICFRSLRKMIPVYTTLAISFLSCHLAREAVLPTDFYKWVLDSKLPYISAFLELEKNFEAFNFPPLSARLMFRPIRIISASFLEMTAASIAQSIGLRTPSVNFYAIALRYLRELSLPVAKILPQACRLYEWSLPSELWLSTCISALPTRVYVMSILIVVIRILCNIHGHGIWENSLFDTGNSTLFEHKSKDDADDATKQSATTDPQCSQISEFCTKKLLHVLDNVYHQMNTTSDYSKDLHSYLKYCGDVIFAGLTPSYEEEKLIERLWNLYDKKEDDDQHAESYSFELKVKRPRDAESTNPSMDLKKVKKEKQELTSRKLSSKSTSTAIESLKFDMEDNGFEYLPPRVVKKSVSYLHYRRQKTDGKYIFVAHADYYILLRACAKLAEVDPRLLHFGVLKFEKKLDWIEQRIDQSFNIMHNCSLKDASIGSGK